VPSTKVSYKAEGPIRELRVTVAQYPHITLIGATWSTREKGDEPQQGHMWRIAHEGKGRIKSRQHAVNLALWVLRKVSADEMTKMR